MFRSFSLNVALVAQCLLAVLAFTSAHANEGHADRDHTKSYNGSAPTDLHNGIPFNNGTYGSLDPEYEAISQGPMTAPGLHAAPYPFAEKERFVAIVDDLLRIYRDGLDNLKHNTDQRAELVEYRKQMSQAMQERLARTESALKDARGASTSNWDEAQNKTRMAFVELQSLIVRTP